MTDENLLAMILKPGHLKGADALGNMITEMKQHGSPALRALGERIEDHMHEIASIACDECGDEIPDDKACYCLDCYEEHADEARDEGFAEGLDKGRAEADEDKDKGSD